MSRIGKKPIAVPSGVKVEVKDGLVSVQGQKGALQRPLLDGIEVDVTDLRAFGEAEGRRQEVEELSWAHEDPRGEHGRGRLQRLREETRDRGHRLPVGGQRQNLALYLGYSHPIDFPLPQGISAEVEKQTLVTIKGIDKELVGQIAAKIRDLRKPDPYKGKGREICGRSFEKESGQDRKEIRG